MIEIIYTPKRYRSRTAVHLAPVLLVAAWGVAWIGFHASQHGYVHTLFQTLALAESVIALLLRRRKPVGALVGILVAYLVFEPDPLLLPALLFALFTVATLRERRTVLLATAATATAVVALPLTGRASVDLAGLLPRLLAVGVAAAIGLWAQTHTTKETR
jgi:FtsH-binding integral membrane protein